MVGYKYKMSNLQAAIGCAQMERIDELIAGKRRIFLSYSERLSGLPIHMNPEHSGTTNGYWMPTIVASESASFRQEALLNSFKQDNIDGRIFFWPLSMLPMFDLRRENSVSYACHERGVNLPTYHDMSDADLEKVCSVVSRVIEGKYGHDL
jgi:perosamine synthetase